MRALKALAIAGIAAFPAIAGQAAAEAAASPDPSSSPDVTVSTAGTSFLTATPVEPGQPVRVSASTGDYLYWSFGATAGQSIKITATVGLPPAAARHGSATWTVDIFDGLRRRQACTAGAQVRTAAAGDGGVTVDCTLRRIRSWSTPWSNEPLPGSYYVRLSAAALPEQDLGLPVRADVRITARNGDAQPDNATLKAPLSPPTEPGTTLAPDAAPPPSPSADASAPKPLQRATGWFSWPSSRWLWTIGGGVLAALAAVAGYSLTRHPHHWFSGTR